MLISDFQEAGWTENKTIGEEWEALKSGNLTVGQCTRKRTMAHFRRLHVINFTALPVVPLNEHLGVSLIAQNALKDAARKNLKDNVPCILLWCRLQWRQRACTEVWRGLYHTPLTNLFLMCLLIFFNDLSPTYPLKEFEAAKECLTWVGFTKIGQKEHQRKTCWKYLLKRWGRRGKKMLYSPYCLLSLLPSKELNLEIETKV